MSDQATHLRRLVGHSMEPRRGAPWAAARTTAPVPPGMSDRNGLSPPIRDTAGPPRLAQAIAVTSGKGGVGKTNLAVNLAVCLARLGRRTCLLDGDLGLANADILCNLSPRLTLEHVINARCRLAEAMLLAPGGFRLIPGACGVAKLADLDRADRASLIQQLAALDHVADDLIIDTGAGLAANVLAFVTAASRVLLVTTPEPTAMTDAYGMVKALTARAPDLDISLVVNMVGPDQEGQAVFDRIDRVSRTFLGKTLDYGGAIPTDEAVGEAIRHRVPFTLYAPDGPATAAVVALARSLLGIEAGDATRGGFFSRLTTWFSHGTDFRESS